MMTIRRSLPAVGSALAVFTATAGAALFPQKGPVSTHMLLHVTLMNVLAPVCASLLQSANVRGDRAALLWGATLFQILLLWLWHAPLAYHAASASLTVMLVMHGSLFAVALVFWIQILSMSERNAWQVVFALLITGKLACLLGALLTFAPRALYGDGHAHSHGGLSKLDDQHLAGVLMMAACPLSFVLAGVILASQVVHGFGRAVPTPAK
jgi:putative membrane protein